MSRSEPPLSRLMSVSELPSEIQGPSAWYGPEQDARRDWIHDLSAGELGEIERAVQATVDRLHDPERDLVSLRKEDFPLPALAQRLARILDDVLSGRGFALIRRLPVEPWSPLQRAVA